MGRVLSLLVLVTVAIGGLLPPSLAYRCVLTEKVAAHACCPKKEAPERAIHAPCCDVLEAPVAAERMTPKDVAPELQPAPFAGWLAAVPAPALVSAYVRAVDAAPPPTRGVLALGSVLRI